MYRATCEDAGGSAVWPPGDGQTTKTFLIEENVKVPSEWHVRGSRRTLVVQKAIVSESMQKFRVWMIANVVANNSSPKGSPATYKRVMHVEGLVKPVQ